MNGNKKLMKDPYYYVQQILKNKFKAKDMPTLINFRNVVGEKHFMTAKRTRKERDENGNVVNVTTTYEKKFDIIKTWEKEQNFTRKIDLWEPFAKKKNGNGCKTYHKWLRFIAVEGPIGMKFPVQPTYQMVFGNKVQYLWRLEKAVPENMMESVEMLAKAIAYLAPGSKSMHTSYDAKIRVPGIPNLISGTPGTFETIGSICSYQKLWSIVGKQFPVHGRSLQKFLCSEAIYVPGLRTTRQFIGIRRLNKLLNAGKRLTKKLFYQCSTNFLFFAWNFARDVGMRDEEILRLLQDYCGRHFSKITDQNIIDAKPVKHYTFRDVTIVEKLGQWAKKYSHTRRDNARL